MDDRELLQEYRERQSENAFTELVARHVRLVYATALRLTRERQAAEDVVQAVFLQLAQKSWMVRDGNTLPGWLYRTTYRTALNELRKEQRRRERETEAMNNAELESGADPMLAQLLPLLDEALRQLNPVDQNLIIQRFFENKSLREAGASAALSEQAAHMRISRAIEKLRKHFARSGVTMAAGVMETVLTVPSSQAMPVGLAAKVTGTALAGSGAALGIADTILKFFFTMNTKTQIALGVVIVGLIALPLIWPASTLMTKTVAARSVMAVSDSPAQSTTLPPSLQKVLPPTAPTLTQSPAPPSTPVKTDPVSPAAPQVNSTQGSNISNRPLAGLPEVTVEEALQSPAKAVNYAGQHPLSHNMALRITGTVGADTQVNVTLVSCVPGSGRDLLFESQNTVFTDIQPVRASFTSTVAPAQDE